MAIDRQNIVSLDLVDDERIRDMLAGVSAGEVVHLELAIRVSDMDDDGMTGTVEEVLNRTDIPEGAGDDVPESPDLEDSVSPVAIVFDGE